MISTNTQKKLSGFGYINVGLPPASPSEREIAQIVRDTGGDHDFISVPSWSVIFIRLLLLVLLLYYYSSYYYFIAVVTIITIAIVFNYYYNSY